MSFKTFYISVCLLILFTSAAPCTADETTKPEQVSMQNSSVKILLLNSYHKGYLWTDEITKGVEDTLKNGKYDLHIEYMDTKRQFDPTYQELLYQIISEKHRRHAYSLLITSDDNAFNFTVKHKESIYGNIPHVFCGLNYLQKESLEGMINTTGIGENANIEANISLIKRVHPSCKEIVIITDDTTTGRKVQNQVNRTIREHSTPDCRIKLIYDISIKDLLSFAEQSGKDRVILFTFFSRDRNGLFLEYDECIKQICHNTVSPVYGTWDFHLGHGITGGYLVNGYDQGKRVAQRAMKILSGISADSIPVDYNTPVIPMFDFKVIEKHSISQAELPEKSILINKPESLFDKHRKLILNTVLAFFILLIIALTATYGLIRSKRAEKKLRYSENLYRTLVENVPGITYRCRINEEQTREFFGQAIESLCGYPSGDFINNRVRSYYSIIHPEDLNMVKETIRKVLKTRNKYSVEYRIIRADKDTAWVFEQGRFFYDEDQQPLHLDGVMLNVTKRKEAETDLRLRSEELIAANEKLLDYQDHLEDLVKERTKELEESRAEAINNAHKAGMADIASEVLHNIGNVLTSIKTSSRIIEVTLKKSSLSKLKKVCELLKSNMDNLEDFIRDDKGKQLMQYILLSADKIESDFRDIESNSERLEDKIDTITDVIAAQQTYTGSDSNISEAASIKDVVEDAIKILSSSTDSIKLIIHKNYKPVPEIIVHKPRLVQIIINLIKNADTAMNHLPESDRQLAINLSRQADNVRLEFRDSGKGMEKDTLESIFHQDYSSNKGTRGFNLHNSANYMREMGGNIRAVSEGYNKGATVTLEFSTSSSFPTIN